MSFNRCELKWCRSGRLAAITVNENIGDGSWAVGICPDCATRLNLRDGDDLPEPETVKRALAAAQQKEPDDE